MACRAYLCIAGLPPTRHLHLRRPCSPWLSASAASPVSSALFSPSWTVFVWTLGHQSRCWRCRCLRWRQQRLKTMTKERESWRRRRSAGGGTDLPGRPCASWAGPAAASRQSPAGVRQACGSPTGRTLVPRKTIRIIQDLFFVQLQSWCHVRHFSYWQGHFFHGNHSTCATSDSNLHIFSVRKRRKPIQQNRYFCQNGSYLTLKMVL